MEINDLVAEVCIERCIELARKASSKIARPLVGAMVVTEKGDIVGEGYKHFIRGTDYLQHAERVALDQADELAQGGYLFTSLEPCIEKRPKIHAFSSCSRLIIERGIKEVVVGLLDNSPSMRPGSGIAFLKKNGIKVHLYQNFEELIMRDLMSHSYRRPKSL